MSPLDGITPALEYQTLRDELLQAKKYVFERPLLILALSIAGMNAVKIDYLVLLLPFSAILLHFNFSFTVSRLQSAARIAAYAHIELEGGAIDHWVGWESCLRYYRRFLNENKNITAEEILIEIEKTNKMIYVPSGLMHYHQIFYLHLTIMILAALSAAVFALITLIGPTLDLTRVLITVFSSILTLAFFASFIRICWKNKPSKVRSLIERNRYLWEKTFQLMKENEVK